MSVVQVRGTSGSGKTTVVRAFMALAGGWTPVYRPGRKKPLYYVSKDLEETVAVLGHYEGTACGGCDTIGSARAVYDLAAELAEGDGPFFHVLCEGLLLSEDVKWSSQFQDLRCLFLVTPPEECLRRVAGRREKVGNDKPLNPKNTLNRVSVIERARVKLNQLGIKCLRTTSHQAPGILLKWLGRGKGEG